MLHLDSNCLVVLNNMWTHELCKIAQQGRDSTAADCCGFQGMSLLGPVASWCDPNICLED